MGQIFNNASEKNRRRALRQHMPETEIILWSKLKGRQCAGYKFRRQYSIGPYIVDFYCAEKKLAVEVDGVSHCLMEDEKTDAARQEWIEQFGIRFLRVTNDDVRNNLSSVLTAIEESLYGE
ncbi:MAG: endonuclease domain-containing protein [bacterium]